MRIEKDMYVFVRSFYTKPVITEYRITEVREHDGECVYLCKTTRPPYIGYSFVESRIGTEVFLSREEAESGI